MPNPLPQNGAVIADKYLVESLIGRGGMGAVYVVTHRLTGKRLALKVLLPQFLDQPEIVSRFVREAQAVGRIEHRHVVDVFDVGQDGDVLYIVMALLAGKPMSSLLREEQVPLSRLLAISLRAMEGVAAAHAEGVIHRDLKPDNIFVCQGVSGQLDDPKILDFGISKQDGPIDARLTQSGVMLGTPHYMAFEQIAGQRDLDARVDVYAMGAILYEALAGSPPFDAESVGGLAVRMMSTTPRPLEERVPGLPLGLGDVIMRALERERDHRYPSMAAFIEALTPYAAVRPSTVEPLLSLVPREAAASGHDVTMVARTPPPTARSGVGLTDSLEAGSGGPSRPLALSIQDNDDQPRARVVSSPGPSSGKRGGTLWVVLAVLALALPWLGSRIAAMLKADTTVEQVTPTPTAVPAPRVVAPEPAKPVVAEEKPAGNPELLPDPRAELAPTEPSVPPPSAPDGERKGKPKRGEKVSEPVREPRPSGRNEYHDSNDTNAPLSGPSGEAFHAPAPVPPAQAPAPATPPPASATPEPSPVPAPAAVAPPPAAVPGLPAEPYGDEPAAAP